MRFVAGGVGRRRVGGFPLSAPLLLSASLPLSAPLLLSASLLLSAPEPLRGQQGPELTLRGGVSHALPPSGGTGDPASFVFGGVGLRAGGPGLAFESVVHGGLNPDAGAGNWLSGRVGVDWMAVPPSPVGVGLEAWGDGFVVGEPLPYRAGRLGAGSRLTLALGAARLVFRGAGSVGETAVTVVRDTGGFVPPPFRDAVVVSAGVPADGSHATVSGRAQNGPPPFVAGDGRETLEASLWSFGGDAWLEVPLAGSRVVVGGGYRETGVGRYAFGRLELSGGGSDVAWRASVSGWETPAGGEAAGELTLVVPLAGDWFAMASAGRSTPDPTLGAPTAVRAVGMVSGYLSLSPVPEPVYTIEGAAEGGGRARVRFRVERPAAERVVVMGDFSEWREVPMHRQDDAWTVRLELEPGVYHFGFRADGTWFVPKSAPARVEDEWGRENATLVVPAARITSRRGTGR